MSRPAVRCLLLAAAALLTLLPACSPSAATRFGEPGEVAYRRAGDEIVAAGKLFHTGTRVLLWTDPGGYDAYRVERRFTPPQEASWEASREKLQTPNRYGLRFADRWPPNVFEQLRGGGWDLPLLQDTVDLFVIHYDVTGSARRTFDILHDHRCLSVHFMLDLDGTIYQTLDLKERAWHAGPANDRSIGIEIANIGAYGEGEREPLEQWYERLPGGLTVITPPNHELPRPLYPARPDPVVGTINGRELMQYDFTPQQYEALAKLTAALVEIFPKLRPDYPRDPSGELLTRPLTDEELADYSGLIGHHHITAVKVDPGPAFQWDRVLGTE